MNIRKINPNKVQLKPMSRGSGAGLKPQSHTIQPEYASGHNSVLSGGSLGAAHTIMPDIKKGSTRSGNRAMLAANLNKNKQAASGEQ